VVVAVVGGTGTVGAFIVAELALRGHEVRVLTRRPPAGGAARHHPVDLSSGEGVAEAVAGARVVVDASNPRPPRKRRARSVLLDGTRHLLEAEIEAGVEHHILVSIVGIDAVPFSYYQTKVAQERAVQAGPTPWTIVRATQFHQLLDETFGSFARVGLLPRSSIPLQPIDPRRATALIARSVEEGPCGDRREIAGPEISSVTELAHTWKRATDKSGLLVPPPIIGETRRALRRGALTAPDAESAGPTFAQWLGARRSMTVSGR
jgi:uncharacterized protein YbjT (DUF2867 family)